jgi:trypsin
MRRVSTHVGLSALGSLQKVGLATTLCFATACEVEDSNVMNTRPQDTVESEIFGGQVDTTHDAVVYLEGGGSCTGTIITAKNGVGWVLTAGHCDTIDYIIIGDDLQAYDVAFNVVQDVPHPQWSGDATNGYDFRLLRFSYSGGDPPVIPAATGDAGLVGQTVTHVGYGLTENGSTNKRRAVNQVVDQIYGTPPVLGFDQSGGVGTCSGDSGGPALRNGEVVGVTSFGDSGCVIEGYSGRVAVVYDWIASTADITDVPAQPTCDECIGTETDQGGDCAATWAACQPQSDCLALDSCYQNCGDDACYAQCDSTYAGVVSLLSDVYNCLCLATVCSDVCGCLYDPNSTGSSMMNGAGGSEANGGNSGNGGANTGDGGTNSAGGSDSAGGANAADDEQDLTGINCSCETPGRSGSPVGAIGLLLAAGISLGRRRRR